MSRVSVTSDLPTVTAVLSRKKAIQTDKETETLTKSNRDKLTFSRSSQIVVSRVSVTSGLATVTAALYCGLSTRLSLSLSAALNRAPRVDLLTVILFR